MRTWRTLCSVFSAFLLASTVWAGSLPYEAFLTLSGNPRFELVSFQHSIPGLASPEALLNTPSGNRNGSSGSGTLIITKELDRSSVWLGKAEGKKFPGAKLALLSPGGSGFLTLNFEKIEFLSNTTRGNIETLRLKYGKVNWSY